MCMERSVCLEDQHSDYVGIFVVKEDHMHLTKSLSVVKIASSPMEIPIALEY